MIAIACTSCVANFTFSYKLKYTFYMSVLVAVYKCLQVLLLHSSMSTQYRFYYIMYKYYVMYN